MDYLPTSTSLVALPLLPRPLKRSASAASLPTPPRTRHKRKSKGGRSEGGDTDSGSDQDDNKAPNPQNKRQKTTVGVEEDEDAFWLGALDAKNKGKVVATQPDDTAKVSTVEAPVSPATALVRRRQQRNVALVAPVSPPPSHRKTRSATAKAKVSASPALTTLSSPPATPRVERPVRDTPNNPFLVPATPMNKFVDEQFFPKTPPKAKEGPTITYVFRGVRGTFPNPHYDHANDRPKSPSPSSRLPIDHPDYSPDAHVLPKLFFPAPKRPTRAAAAKASSADDADLSSLLFNDTPDGASFFESPSHPTTLLPRTPTRTRGGSKLANLPSTAKSASRRRLMSPFDEDVVDEEGDEEDSADLRKMVPSFKLRPGASLVKPIAPIAPVKSSRKVPVPGTPAKSTRSQTRKPTDIPPPKYSVDVFDVGKAKGKAKGKKAAVANGGDVVEIAEKKTKAASGSPTKVSKSNKATLSPAKK